MDCKQENAEHNLKVKCLKSYNSILTEGKIYEVIDVSETFYGVVNDEGEAWLYYKGDFEVVKEDIRVW